MAEMFREKVEASTDGRVQVQTFPSSQLGNDRKLFSSARSGSVDVVMTPYPMLADIVPELSIYVAGYMFNGFDEQQQILEHPDLGKAWAERLREEGGLRVLCSFLYGTRHLTTSDTPVKSREDLAGLKIRAVPHPSSMSVVRGLGGTPTPVPFSEIFQGLQQGVIDGQENPLSTIDRQRIYEVQDYLMLTGHQLVALPVAINERAWQELDEQDRDAVQAAADESCEVGTRLTQEEEAELVNAFTERGMQVIAPEDGLDLAAFKEAVRAEVAETFDGEIWPEGTSDAVSSALGR
ncbi:DctP family TRAP transporter solute-binding subunit [Amorphus sp. 3PC139-8]